MGGFVALAFKNVFRSRKRSFTLGVNYAIVSFILVALLAFARGASDNISSSLARASAGHITVSGQYAKGGRIYAGMLRAPEVSAIAEKALGPGAEALPRYLVRSLVYCKGLSKRLAFTGIDAARDAGFRGQMRFSSGSWDAWAADPSGVAVPASNASYFGIGEGDEIVLSARTGVGAFNTGILKVRGVYSTDNYFMRDLVLVGLPFLRSLDLASGDSATAVYVYLPSAAGLAAKREALSKALAAAGFEVSKPKDDNEAIAAVSSASVKYEADKENRDRIMLKLSTLDEVLGIVRSVLGAVGALGALVAAVMLFVIAVSIFINMRMSVNERLREIGTMRAIGVDAGGVAGLFVLESSALALMSAAAGAILGAAACLAMRYAVPIPAGGELAIFLSSGRLALKPDLLDMALVVASIVLFAALFSYFPARRGGRIRPVDALASTF
jgi:putative ABC transport system permease protein